MPDTQKIKTRCPHCKASFKVSAQHVGKVAKCPADGCGEKFKVKAVAPRPKPRRPMEEELDPDNPFADPHAISEPPNRYLAEVPHQEPSAFEVAQSARASNPGEVQVNYLRWVRSSPTWPLVLTSLLAVSLVLISVMPGFIFGTVFLLVLGVNYLYWRRVTAHFQNGDTNPGVVVALDPTLIAVFTDLTMGEGEYPVIKILEIHLTESGGQQLELGSYVPTIALYDFPIPNDAPHWSDFQPIPAEYGTGDPEVVAQLMSTFDQAYYSNLLEGLKLVPKPYEEGLYVLWPEPGKELGRRADFREARER
ncbi:DUF3239 domain-containing protein [Aeoliella sp.]|uniref:DUF3239 domain-containing protein n=1 Tax=Aeoliella sp. TaxID=2795800 RepID=UPI003CCBDF88